MQRNVRMPHRVNALVQSMKPPRLSRAKHLCVGVPQHAAELPNRDHPVLSSGERSEPLAPWQSFSTHSE